jgi:hypothetical protein
MGNIAIIRFYGYCGVIEGIQRVQGSGFEGYVFSKCIPIPDYRFTILDPPYSELTSEP